MSGYVEGSLRNIFLRMAGREARPSGVPSPLQFGDEGEGRWESGLPHMLWRLLHLTLACAPSHSHTSSELAAVLLTCLYLFYIYLVCFLNS